MVIFSLKLILFLEKPEMDFKLKDVGSGIVNIDGGLEEALKMLKLEQSQIQEQDTNIES
jgi:hypothetical protein